MSDETARKCITIAVPAYNEERNIPLVYAEVKRVMARFEDRYDWELIFGDNRSTDDTWAVLKELAADDERVRAVRYSRNFGYQNSVLTLLLVARGDAILQLDCDLQDPPEMIDTMIEHWEQGYKVVYGVRRGRREGFWITQARKVFYRLISLLSEDELPLDAGDFRLIDRRVVDVMREIYDSSPYVRGTIASLGFEQIGIEYDRDARQHGTTNFSFFQLVSLAVDGILNHSLQPLRIASWTSLAAVVCSITLLGIYFVGVTFFGLAAPAGWTTLTFLILISLALNAAFLGILGEYLGRIYRQVKTRPITVIDEVANFRGRPQGHGIH